MKLLINITAAAFLSVSLLAQDFRIISIELDAANRPRLEFEASPESYYVLFRGESVQNLNSPVAITTNSSVLIDPMAFGLMDRSRFFRIRKAPLAAPLDTDGDSIDDLFEMRLPTVLSPLNSADGNEDPDNDDLTNAEEYALGTNLEAADTDGDGWIDGIERGDGTDPFNPASRPQHSLLARPNVLLDLPSPDAAGTSGQSLVLARPPLLIDVPSADFYGTSGTAIVLARPSLQIDLPSAEAFGATDTATYLARPPISIDIPSADALGVTGNGVFWADPPVMIDLPSADAAGASGSYLLLAKPPVNIRISSQ